MISYLLNYMQSSCLSGAIIAIAGEDDAGAAVGVAGDPGAVDREHHQQHQHSHNHNRSGDEYII